MSGHTHPGGGARLVLRALPAPVGRARSCRGAVSAETAIVLPVLVAVALGLVWVMSLAVTQIRVLDAARETARSLARDDPAATAIALGDRVAPAGSRIDVERSEDLVTVRVAAEVTGPGGLFGFLPRVEVDAVAVTARETP